MAKPIALKNQSRGIKLRTDILMQLWLSPDGERTDRIAKAVGLSSGALSRHMCQLEQAGQVVWQRGADRRTRGFVRLVGPS